jgi:hypothetical protein
MTTSQDWERRRNRWAEYKAQQEGNAMTHDETRDNTTAIETVAIEADAPAFWSMCECDDYGLVDAFDTPVISAI